MDQNSASLPQGAGATTSEAIANVSAYETGAAASRGPDSREIVVAETRNRPATATVAGAALVGALAGAAIPFMLSGRGASRGAASRNSREDSLVSESIVIQRPAREIYDFWRNFENLPQFMDNIKSVQTLGASRSHWVIKAPVGTSVEFDSRVIEDVPGRAIAWRSEEGASVPNRGRVEFIETASGTGTNVRVSISYDPPAGAAGRLIAKLFQREPSVQAREDLARLKQLLETGRTGA
jgi:uncharacterized membrane protein